MKKGNSTIVIVITIVVALASSLLYFRGKNKSSAPSAPSAAAPDHHGHDMTASVSLSSLDDLIGKPAPDFSLADRDGKIYSADNLKGKIVILFFNEGLMCYPSCWNQIASLAKDERFKANDIAVLSVVVDAKEDWQQAINKMPELAQATVVFDDRAAVSKRFGVLSTRSSMHPGSFPGHTYVVIDAEGIVRYVFDDPDMGIRNDQLVAEMGGRLGLIK